MLLQGVRALELPLDKYGLDGEKASGELVNFSDSSGTPQVSFFVLPDYNPPVAACAMNEILALISSEASSTQPILIVPFITRSANYYHGAKTGQLATLHGVEIGATTEFTQMLVDGTTKLPQSLQMRSEPILCLLQMVRVLNIPTVLRFASGGQHQGKSSADADLEVLQCVGDHLARHINLEFSKETVLERGGRKITGLSGTMALTVPVTKFWHAQHPLTISLVGLTCWISAVYQNGGSGVSKTQSV